METVSYQYARRRKIKDVPYPHRYRYYLKDGVYYPDAPIPEKWYIVITPENKAEINDYRMKVRGESILYNSSLWAMASYYLGYKLCTCGLDSGGDLKFLGFEEIDIDTFRLVVAQDK